MFQWIQKEPLSLNLGGELVSLSRPLIMGILYITPDSFYPGSRTTEEEQIAERLHKMVNEGADIIDIGAYSSRPNADDISPDEERNDFRRDSILSANYIPMHEFRSIHFVPI